MSIKMDTLRGATLGSGVFIALCLVVGLALQFCDLGCASAPAATPAAAEASYTAQQLKCIDDSNTREESRACRAAVDKRWGVDSGAGKDGGK